MRPDRGITWRSLVQFRLKTLLAVVTIFCLAGGGGLVWWRTPFEVEELTLSSAWTREEKVLEEEYRHAQQQPDHERYRELRDKWARLKRGHPQQQPREYKQVATVYRDLRGEPVRHGTLTVSDLEGNRLRVENWVHGKLHGGWTDWYPTGEKLAEGQFLLGEKHGEWLTWSKYYPDRLEREVYEYGVLRRSEEHYSGRARQVRLYENGFLANRTIWDGKIKTHDLRYRQGVAHGKATYYYDTGQKRFEAVYADGQQHGPVSMWHENGELIMSGQFTNDREEGRWKWFDETGELAREVEFRQGMLVNGSGETWPPIVPNQSNPQSNAVRSIATTLEDHTDIDFTDQALSNVMLYVEDRHQIQIEVDWRALRAAGWQSEDELKITEMLASVTLSAALQIMLDPHDLRAALRHDVLVITTRHGRETWRDRTGIPEIMANPASPLTPVLAEDYDIHTFQAPLEKLLSSLPLEVHWDESAFSDSASVKQSPVTSILRGIPLASVLGYLFDQHELTCIEREGALLIRPIAVDDTAEVEVEENDSQ